MTDSNLHRAARRVADAAAKLGLAIDIVTFEHSTRTAAEAAQAVGCDVGQIVKSLVFTVKDEPVITLVSGANQLDTRKLAALFGVGRKQVERASAEIVRSATGFAIGGVPPFGHATSGHATSTSIYIDQDLTQYDVIWAAAGTPNAVFAIAPVALVQAVGGHVIDLKVEPPTN